MNLNKSKSQPVCERIVVRSANGKVYDLGNPNSRLYPLRVWLYKRKRAIHG